MPDALLELIARFLVDFVFYTVLYGIGFIMLKAVTAGRYPPPKPQKHNEQLVAVFPIAVLFVALTVKFS